MRILALQFNAQEYIELVDCLDYEGHTLRAIFNTAIELTSELLASGFNDFNIEADDYTGIPKKGLDNSYHWFSLRAVPRKNAELSDLNEKRLATLKKQFKVNTDKATMVICLKMLRKHVNTNGTGILNDFRLQDGENGKARLRIAIDYKYMDLLQKEAETLKINPNKLASIIVSEYYKKKEEK